MNNCTIKIEFNQDDINIINQIQTIYPKKEASLLPVLWYSQNKFGWISDEVVILIANHLDISPSKVYGVISFYSMFHKKPVGKYHIQVCTNVSCLLKNGVKIFNYISDKLGIKNSEVTNDGLFSIEEVECMGACAGAPMIAINEDYYENITFEKIDELLGCLK